MSEICGSAWIPWAKRESYSDRERISVSKNRGFSPDSGFETGIEICCPDLKPGKLCDFVRETEEIGVGNRTPCGAAGFETGQSPRYH